MPGRPMLGTNTLVETQAAARMLKAVGFKVNQVRFLLDEDITEAPARSFKWAFTKRQLATLASASNLGDLVTGGFTRPQAKVLLELAIVV